MSTDPELFVLPRPGNTTSSPQKTISGPSESHFTKAFGQLLPPAKFLKTEDGNAAYYDLPPLTHSPENESHVLIVHGVQTPAVGVLPLAQGLQASFPHAHLVLVDLWGHGLSDTPVVPHEPALFIRLLDSLLTHLAWPTVHLIGFSFGGALTCQYVSLYPKRVLSFTIIAPAGLFRYEADFSSEEKTHLQGGNEKAAKNWVIEWLGASPVDHKGWTDRIKKREVVAEAVKEWQMREHPGHIASVVAIVRDAGIMDRHAIFSKAANSKIPSLGIVGGQDGVCTDRQLKEVGFSNVHVVPQAGHEVVRKNVAEVVALIRAFWTDIAVS